MKSETESSRTNGRRHSRFDSRVVSSIYLALMFVVFSVIALWMLVQLQSLLVLIFVALLIATSLAGPVRKMEEWGVPRAASILLSFLSVALLVVGIIWFTVPPLIGQMTEAVESISDRISQFERLQTRFNELEVEYPVLGELETRAVDSVGGMVDTISQQIVALPAMLTLLIFIVTSLMTLSFLMLMSWSTIKPASMRLIHPNHRAITEHVLTSAGERLGAYVRAKVVISTIIGIWMYITLLLLSSPIALLVSIVTAIFEVIPRIGPLVARVFIVIAVLPLGWRAVLIAFVSHMVIDNIKGSWLSPLIEGHQVEVHPLTAFVAVLTGAMLMGWMGALIAVPAAAVVQVIIEEVVIPWRLRQLGVLEAVPDIAEQEADLGTEI